MNLKKIEIYGFKSFSDKTTMQFDYPITGVVGPNGCGKSNVVDSIRWVLGEQSAKSLRGKAMQDLIFNGTEQRKSMSYCEISLFLDNKNRVFPIEMDEIVISRKLYRNNESEYLLNKNPVRLKDISDLLRDAGLGREGYSIVGQGRMDAILNARPEDRRAIFEEALGISKFRVRKVETERKLEKTRDNMSQLYIILNELEKQLGPLKKQASDATKYFEYVEQLKYHEINTYIYSYDTANDKKVELNAKIKALDEQIVVTNEKYNTANDLYEKLFNEINNIDALLNTYRSQQLELSVRIERMSGESRLINERINSLMRSNNDYIRQIDEAKQLVEKAKSNMEEIMATQASKRYEHEMLTHNLNELNDKYLGYSDQILEQQENLEKSQNQVMAILAQLSSQESKVSAYNGERTTLLKRLERVNNDIEEINRKVETLSNEQSKDIDELIEGNYSQLSADKLANDVNGYVTAIKSMLDKVVLSLETKNKVIKLLQDVSVKVVTELKKSDFTHENWQQNLILMSALKERFAKYSALHDVQRNALAKVNFEKEQLELRIGEIDKSLSIANGFISDLTKQKENAMESREEYQESYNEVKLQKDRLHEDITALKLKLANIASNIMSADNSINSSKQTIVRVTNDITQKTRQIEANKHNIDELYKELANCGENAEDTEKLNIVNSKLKEIDKLKAEIQSKFADADHDRQLYSTEGQQLTDARTREEYNLLRIDDDINALQEKILNDYNHTYSSAMQFKDENYDMSKSKQEITKYRNLLAKLPYVNPNAVEDYEQTQTRYNDINTQMQDLKTAEADLNKILKDLTKEIVVRFNDGFEIISHNFGVVFKELFAGGHARMTIEQDENKDELDYGIEIEAQPPGKKLQNISLLSGGERTLTAAAILFAILKLRPMPFCVLDEIEAALDDANAQRIADYIKKFSNDTQFIVITHKKPTMEACDVLYGVTMEEKGVSRMVSVQLTEAVKVAV